MLPAQERQGEVVHSHGLWGGAWLKALDSPIWQKRTFVSILQCSLSIQILFGGVRRISKAVLRKFSIPLCNSQSLSWLFNDWARQCSAASIQQTWGLLWSCRWCLGTLRFALSDFGASWCQGFNWLHMRHRP